MEKQSVREGMDRSVDGSPLRLNKRGDSGFHQSVCEYSRLAEGTGGFHFQGTVSVIF